MSNKISSLILAAFVLCCLADVAHGCSCYGGSVRCALSRGEEAVFVGIVTSVTIDDVETLIGEKKYSHKYRVAQFSIEESLNGIDQKSVEVVTGMGGGDCGYDFKTGERYLVYGNPNKVQTTAGERPITVLSNGPAVTALLTTTICSRTRPLAEATDDIELIRAANAGKPETRIFGRVLEYARDAGSPSGYARGMAGVTVKADNENHHYVVTTDSDGRYQFRGIEPGIYTVTLLLPDTHEIVGGTRRAAVKADVSNTCGDEVNFYAIKRGTSLWGPP